MLFVMRGRVETDRQLCFANRPSGNKHYANHSPNESITPGPIRWENKCLHLTQHGGSGTGKMQFLNTQAARHSLVFLHGRDNLLRLSARKVKQCGRPDSHTKKSAQIVAVKRKKLEFFPVNEGTSERARQTNRRKPFADTTQWLPVTFQTRRV